MSEEPKSFEQEEDEFIDEVLRDTLKIYDQEHKVATPNSQNARQRKQIDRPSTSIARVPTSYNAASTSRQPAKLQAGMCSYHQQVYKQLEDLDSMRRQEFSASTALNVDMNRAVDGLVAGIRADIQAQRPPNTSSTNLSYKTGRDSTSALGKESQFQAGNVSKSSISKKAQASAPSRISNSTTTVRGNSAVPVPPSKDRYQLPEHADYTSVSRKLGVAHTNEAKTKSSGPPLQGAGVVESQQNLSGPSKLVALSPTQLKLKMQEIIPEDAGGKELHLSDGDFLRIEELLLQGNQEEWSSRPRIYALLRLIGATDLMDDFVKHECLDIALPYTRGKLPPSLSSDQHDRFLANQRAVMTKAARLEGGLRSTHANFADNADTHLESLETLGRGRFGIVDHVKSRLSRKKYVRKRIERLDTFEQSAEVLKSFKREVGHLKRLSHRHLVRYVGSYTDPQYLGIIMHPVAESNLKIYLSKDSFNKAEARCIREAFGCLCAAVVYLHNCRTRHEDLKPKNILIKRRKVIVTDFGLAINWDTFGRSTTAGPPKGFSELYAPPEVLDHDPRKTSADIWSLGCVYLDMISALKGETEDTRHKFFERNGSTSIDPCHNPEALEEWLKKLESKSNVDNAPIVWIRKMLVKAPDARPKAKELMQLILDNSDERVYSGSCCDGVEEKGLPKELQNSEDDDFSISEDNSGNEALEESIDPALLERRLCGAAVANDLKLLIHWLRKARRLRQKGLKTQAVHRAAANNHYEILKRLIEFGCDLEYTETGHIPLSTAVCNLCSSTTRLLASTKIGLNAKHPVRSTSVLHFAARKSFRTGMKILLDAGATVDIRNKYDITPLHEAVIKGDSLAVKMLLEYGADVSLRDCNGLNALQLASKRKSDNVLAVLLDHGAEVDACDLTAREVFTPLTYAIMSNTPTMIRKLLEKGANVNFQARAHGDPVLCPLHQAVKRNMRSAVEIILEFKPDLEMQDSLKRSPLTSACYNSTGVEMVKLLLAAGADPGTKLHHGTPLVIEIIKANRFTLAQLLIDSGARLDWRGTRRETLIHSLASQDRFEAIEFVLKNDFDINAQDSSGRTPLMVAAQNDYISTIRVLLEHGASIDMQDRSRCTALHWAVTTGLSESVTLLLEHRADPMICQHRGFSALGLAKFYGHPDAWDLMSKSLKSAGRVVYDPRWPNVPIYLLRVAMEQGYVIVDSGRGPFVRLLPKKAILNSTDSLDASPGQQSKALSAQYQSTKIPGSPAMPTISERTSDDSVPRASTGLSERSDSGPRLLMQNVEESSSPLHTSRSSSIDSNRAVYGGAIPPLTSVRRSTEQGREPGRVFEIPDDVSESKLDQLEKGD